MEVELVHQNEARRLGEGSLHVRPKWGREEQPVTLAVRRGNISEDSTRKTEEKFHLRVWARRKRALAATECVADRPQ